MAKAKITCKCEICGGTFEHVRTCINRSDADSYAEWAAEHVTVCPSCHAAAKKAEAASKLNAYIAENFGAEHPLPKITGVSEKQIAYAESLRTKFISSDLSGCNVKLSRFFAAEDKIRLENMSEEGRAAAEKQAEAEGLSVEAWFAKNRPAIVARTSKISFVDIVKKIEVIVNESNASKIIDALR
jgi:hypothetical protein